MLITHALNGQKPIKS